MTSPRLASTSLVCLLCATACDPEPEEFAAWAETDDDFAEPGSPALDLPADDDASADVEASNDDQTVSCDLGLPNVVVADANNRGTTTITLTGINPGSYFHFEAVTPIYPALEYLYITTNYLPYPSIFYSGMYFGPTWSSTYAQNGEIFHLTMQAFAGAPAGWSYDVEIQLHDYSGELCSDHVTLILPPDCGNVAWWSTNPWPTPFFDGANCYVAALPQTAKNAFVWNNGWYVQANNSNQCSVGVFDGVNCYIGSAPAGHDAFIWQGGLYYEP